MEIKDIPLIGNYSYADETNNKYVKNYNIDSNQLYYKIVESLNFQLLCNC